MTTFEKALIAELKGIRKELSKLNATRNVNVAEDARKELEQIFPKNELVAPIENMLNKSYAPLSAPLSRP